MTMGQRIAEQRKKLGMSQEGLGEKLEVSRQAVSKWESDGAVPDVDKLIAMSKLFDVSVGWLLGVEEEPDPAKAEELTEKQLRMIEEIVKRYQPEQTVVTQSMMKKQSKWFRVLTVAGITAAVILAVTALNKIQALPNYDNQLNNISKNYNNVQSQLEALSQQLDDLAKEEPLLTEYSFAAVGFQDLSGAEITFHALPEQWQDGDTGFLVVRLKGKEITSVQCSFSGSGYTAVLELPPANGYSYCFVQAHADGSREQQILENVNYYCTYVAESLQINCSGDVSWHRDVDIKSGEVNLCLDYCQLYLVSPALLPQRYQQKWESARIIFQLNDNELKSYDLLLWKNEFKNPVVYEPDLDVEFIIDDFLIPMEDGDCVTAIFEGRLSNGMTFDSGITCWYRRGEQIVEFASSDEMN